MASSTISNLMGEPAVWLSSNRGNIPGRALFKDPSEPTQIGDSEGYEYRPSTATAEYYEDNFVGMKQDDRIPRNPREAVFGHSGGDQI